MKYKSSFKKFGGDYIPDVIEYLKVYIERDPTVTITVGCDSIQKRRTTVYAITIMLYNGDIKNGAHVIFFRETQSKIRDNQERLYKEALYLHDIGIYLHNELSDFYSRLDLTDLEKKRYKYHLLKCSGEYLHVPSHQEEGVIKNLTITPSDMMDFKLVDLHVDFNPVPGTINEKGVSKNRSYTAYKAYTPWLRGMGFRTWTKPLAHASSTAADLLLKD
jgi:predicted RNase H-related nuclease YkuK (DUF458 family)